MTRSLGPALAESQGFPDAVTLERSILLPVVGADLDNDGLSDAGEAELARAFRPFFVFDSRENALRLHEPVTLFQLRPLGCAGPRSRCAGRPLTLKLIYENLWRRDGGYGPESFFCSGVDSHLGDDQNVTLTLVSDDDGRTFRVSAIDIGAYVWPTRSGAVHFLAGTHFWLFFSAGKHHHYFDARMNGRSSPYSRWNCNDSVDGKGVFYLSETGWPGSGLVVKANNVGEPEAHDPLSFVGALDAYGFNGESAWGTRHFCGGLRCEPSNPTTSLASQWATDAFYVPATP